MGRNSGHFQDVLRSSLTLADPGPQVRVLLAGQRVGEGLGKELLALSKEGREAKQGQRGHLLAMEQRCDEAARVEEGLREEVRRLVEEQKLELDQLWERHAVEEEELLERQAVAKQRLEEEAARRSRERREVEAQVGKLRIRAPDTRDPNIIR